MKRTADVALRASLVAGCLAAYPLLHAMRWVWVNPPFEGHPPPYSAGAAAVCLALWITVGAVAAWGTGSARAAAGYGAVSAGIASIFGGSLAAASVGGLWVLRQAYDGPVGDALPHILALSLGMIAVGPPLALLITCALGAACGVLGARLAGRAFGLRLQGGGTRTAPWTWVGASLVAGPPLVAPLAVYTTSWAWMAAAMTSSFRELPSGGPVAGVLGWALVSFLLFALVAALVRRAAEGWREVLHLAHRRGSTPLIASMWVFLALVMCAEDGLIKVRQIPSFHPGFWAALAIVLLVPGAALALAAIGARRPPFRGAFSPWTPFDATLLGFVVWHGLSWFVDAVGLAAALGTVNAITPLSAGGAEAQFAATPPSLHACPRGHRPPQGHLCGAAPRHRNRHDLGAPPLGSPLGRPPRPSGRRAHRLATRPRTRRLSPFRPSPAPPPGYGATQRIQRAHQEGGDPWN